MPLILPESTGERPYTVDLDPLIATVTSGNGQMLKMAYLEISQAQPTVNTN